MKFQIILEAKDKKKFQIILEARDKKSAQMADDEFEKLVRRQVKLPGFQLIGARSLEGIQSKAWEPARRRENARDPLD